MRYVVTVAKEHSFSQAAKKLFVSQSAMSQQIQKLEKDLDLQLFYRSTRTVGTTDAGLLFCKYAEQVLEDHDRLKSVMDEYRHQMDNSLAVMYMSELNPVGMSGILGRFYANNPGIQLTMTECGSDDVDYKIINTHWDVFVLRESEFNTFLKSEGFHYERLFKDPLGIAYPAGHSLEGLKSVDASALRGEKIINMPGDPSVKKPSDSHGPSPADSVMSEAVIAELVKNGSCCALLPASIARSFGLCWTALSPERSNDVYLVAANEKLRIDIIKRFISCLKQSFRDI